MNDFNALFYETLKKKLPLCGRDREMSVLLCSLADVISGEGLFSIITGEDGSGKTRFIEEFKTRIQTPPFISLHGKATENSTFMHAFSALLNSFFEFNRDKPKLLTSIVPSKEAQVLSNFCPVLAENYPYLITSIHSADKATVFESFYKAFKKISTLWPLVITLDDADLLDSGSMDFLRNFTEGISDLSILILVSATNAETLPPVSSSTFRFELKNMDIASIEESLNSFFKTLLNREFLEWVFAQTKGIPYFVDEIIKSLIKSNVIYRKDDSWEVDDFYEDYKLPENVVFYFKEKLEKLPGDEFSLLASVSVFGKPFSEKAAQFMSCDHRSNHSILLTSLERKSLLSRDKNNLFDFSSPLVRKAVLETIDENEIKTFHRKAAVFFSSGEFKDSLMETHHLTRFLSADEYSPDLVKIIEDSVYELKINHNWKKATEYMSILQNIMETLEEFTDKDVLKIKFKQVIPYINLMSAKFDEKLYLDLMQELYSSGLIHEWAILSNFISRNYLDMFEFDKAEKLMEKTLSLIPENLPEERWKVKYNKCILLVKQGLYLKAVTQCKELIDEIEPDISPHGKWFPLNLLGSIYFLTGKLKKAREIFQKSLETRDTNCEAVSLGNLGLVLRELGEISLSEKHILKSFELLHSTGYSLKIAKTHDFLASQALLRQNISLAKSHCASCRQIAEKKGHRDLVLESQLKNCRIYIEEGEFEKAEKEFGRIPLNQIEDLDVTIKIEGDFIRSYLEQSNKHYSKALSSTQEALERSRNSKLKIYEAIAISRKASVLALQNKTRKAETEFSSAEKILSKCGALFSLARQKSEFALCLKGTKQKTLLNASFDIFEKIGLPQQKTYFARKAGIKEKGDTPSSLPSEAKEKKLKITTFGGLTLEDIRLMKIFSEKDWGSKKSKELLALLIISSGKKGETREKLESQLWPDKGPKAAQNNFHVNLTYLRKAVGADAILCDDPFYRINTDIIDVDCYDFNRINNYFEKEKSGAKPHTAEKHARDLVSIYKGDFLPEMYSLSIDDEQLFYREKIKEVLMWLAGIAKERNDTRELREFSHFLLAVDPFDERAHRFLMESYIISGDRNSAIIQFNKLCHLLESELGVLPEKKTADLIKEIKNSDS
ncbi:AAA family ATPase [candidate division WOR-3 bacterium]|nr:AAA family ATPase [candidate division WOR-3 bacterium]